MAEDAAMSRIDMTTDPSTPIFIIPSRNTTRYDLCRVQYRIQIEIKLFPITRYCLGRNPVFCTCTKAFASPREIQGRQVFPHASDHVRLDHVAISSSEYRHLKRSGDCPRDRALARHREFAQGRQKTTLMPTEFLARIAHAVISARGFFDEVAALSR